MKPDNIGKVTLFALTCVAIIAVFLMILAGVLVYLLQADWCAIAIGNAKYVDGRPETAIQGCIDLLKLQVQGLAQPLLYAICGFVGVLIVLMVIVVARGKASVQAPGGFGASVGGDDPLTPAEGAQAATDAATAAGQDIVTDLQERAP